MTVTNRILPLSLLAAMATLVLAGAAPSADATQRGAVTANVRAPAGAALVQVGRAATLSPGATVTGAVADTQPLQVVVALKLRDRAALEALVAAGGQLTQAQLRLRHWPTQVQADTLANYLAATGFADIVVSPNRMLVSGRGTTANAKAAFLTSFVTVRTADGRKAFANSTDVQVPAQLAESVLSVLGLDDVNHVQSYAREVKLAPARSTVIAHNPVDFSPIYGGTGVADAAGITVGIMTVGHLAQPIANLALFTANNGLPDVLTETVNTNGTSFDEQGALEWSLDSQAIVGAAGGAVGKLIFYNAPSFLFTDLVLDIETAVTANEAKIINISLGACELYARNTGSAAATDALFLLGAAQGQTFAVATGDVGANNCAPRPGLYPSWPASSPHALAVSGTLLNATTTQWNGEVVWNDRTGATGGSLSTFEPKQAWQAPFLAGELRGVPDIAFAGSGISGALIEYNGGIAQVGGTSLAAPIFAGLWARVLAIKGVDVGFAPPILYGLPASDFRDITSGGNGGSTAGPGYDLATGRGSLILSSALAHIGTTPGNIAPQAAFNSSVVGLVARFTDASSDSDGSVAGYSWTFGDGRRSSLANPRNIYARAGSYTVTLTVTDNGGLSSSWTTTIVAAR